MTGKQHRAARRSRSRAIANVEIASNDLFGNFNKYSKEAEEMITGMELQIAALRATNQNQAREISALIARNRSLTKKLTNIANHRQRNKEKRENKFREQENANGCTADH